MHIRHAAPSRPNILSADQVLAAEREHLRPGKRLPLPAFAALCLSGGGIRSAAFSLGVLQALAGRRLLTEFDYLSTVSGGGFIGGWLQVLIHRKGARGAEDTLRDPKAPELVELRSYTNYLTPQAGPFTGDTWTAVALYLRNLLLNWLVIVPALLSAVLALIAHRTAVATFGRPEFWPSLMLVLTMALLFAAAMQACMLLPSHRADSPAPEPQRYASPDKIQRWIVYPTLGWSLLMPVALHPLLADAGWPAMAMLPGCYFVCMLAAYGCAWARQRRSPAVSELFRINTGAWIAATVLATAALWLAECWYVNLDLYSDDQAQALTTFAPLVLTLCHMLHAVIYVGLRKERMFSDLDREWIARLDGPILLYAFIWTAACLCCLELSAQLIPVGMRPFGTGTTWAVAITTVLTGPGVAWLGKQTLSRVEKGITGASGRQVSLRRLLDGFAAVFAVGLFAFFGVALQFLLGVVQQALGLDRLGDGVSVFLRLLGLQLLVGALLRGVSYGFSRVNVNRFSMHGVYRNRLSRAFLGTALESRRPDPFTGFGPLENPRLADFAAQPGEPRLFPVINIALNLTRSNHTAWAERKAASFTATPLACGSAELCPNQSGSSGAFVRTPDFAGATSRFDREGGRLGIRLGTALAISGAAVSPNWGYNSSALTAFLMTMFNVRLGAWLPNPAVSTEDELRLASPSNSHAAIFDELRGVATDRRQSMYLSDGGHFENLGLYEMLRRQCSRLLVVDAGQDRGCAFADLGNAIRKAAIDGLAEVTMQPIRILSRSVLEAKRRDPGPPLGLAVGTVRYPGGRTGQLVYLKPTYLPAIPAEIRAYGAAHPEFPHESTAEQWFTESQFESYRALGEWQMAELLRQIPQDAADPFASLFEQAQTIAAPPPSCPSIREVPKTGPGVFMRYTALALLALIGCTGLAGAQPLDEARRAGRTAASLPHAGEDYFRDMDNGIALTPDEVRGRNMWLVWTGGNDRFWDGMTRSTFGAFDLLKVVSSHPGQKAGRDSRWNWLGVINEPCYEQPTGPDPARFGLWLDRRSPGCPADPFRRRRQIPRHRHRRPRRHRSGRVVLRRTNRHRRPPPVPEPRVQRGRPGSIGTPSATTPTRATTTIPPWCGPTGSA